MTSGWVSVLLVALAGAATAAGQAFPQYAVLLTPLATFLAGIAVPTPGKPQQQ